MNIAAHLDVDLIAVETGDEVSVLIELTAPPAPEPDASEAKPARTLQVVLDRSGSMQGDRIDGAVTALLALVDRLDPTDNFGLVAFNNDVRLVVPVGPLTDKAHVKHAIASIHADGGTDLSAGYLRGIQEARRVARLAGATVLLISDGHANAGVVDPVALGGIAAEAHRNGLVTSTLGWGLGYDERLMSAIARGGSGNELFAEDSDVAIGLIAGEVEGLLAQTAQAASVHIGFTEHVQHVKVVNELPITPTDGGLIAELGSFYAGETRKLLLTFTVPALPSLGLTEIATLTFTWVELPALKQHTVTVPIHVNVVPGDQAAGRVPDPTVRSELMYQQVQHIKRRASASLTDGDADAALADIQAARAIVDTLLALDGLSPDFTADVTEEARVLQHLQEQTEYGQTAYAAKFSSMDSSYKTHKRGRRTPGSLPPQPPVTT